MIQNWSAMSIAELIISYEKQFDVFATNHPFVKKPYQELLKEAEGILKLMSDFNFFFEHSSQITLIQFTVQEYKRFFAQILNVKNPAQFMTLGLTTYKDTPLFKIFVFATRFFATALPQIANGSNFPSQILKLQEYSAKYFLKMFINSCEALYSQFTAIQQSAKLEQEADEAARKDNYELALTKLNESARLSCIHIEILFADRQFRIQKDENEWSLAIYEQPFRLRHKMNALAAKRDS